MVYLVSNLVNLEAAGRGFVFRISGGGELFAVLVERDYFYRERWSIYDG